MSCDNVVMATQTLRGLCQVLLKLRPGSELQLAEVLERLMLEYSTPADQAPLRRALRAQCQVLVTVIGVQRGELAAAAALLRDHYAGRSPLAE